MQKIVIAINQTKMRMPYKKNSYHPFISLAYQLNFLPSELWLQLPRSTRHDWQHKDQSTLFGHDYFLANRDKFNTLEAVANNYTLLTINKALLKVIALKKYMVANKERLHKGFVNTTAVVVSNIKKIKEAAKPFVCQQQILNALDLHRNTYLNWKRNFNCRHSLLNLCVIKYPNQLLPQEVNAMKQYLQNEKYLHWHLNQVHIQMLRDGVTTMHERTFYKYAKTLNIVRKKSKNRHKNHKIGIRANAPLELLHIDVSLIKCQDNTTAYIYAIIDNYSRAILYAYAATKLNKLYTEQCLQYVYDAYLRNSNTNTIVMSDGGSENKSINKWINTLPAPNIFKHVTAQVDIDCSNSMIEHIFKRMKYGGLYHECIADTNSLIRILPNIVDNLNNVPQKVLQKRTALEALNNIDIAMVIQKPENPITPTYRIKYHKGITCCRSYSF